ncbi:uncharacterized protein LOC131806995 [Musca domestica]|uniref:Uncharacterized protein LOC131806995 n=1 Tax=Musca domestica TaxID=7370 RepID=A0ABM3VQ97_MUSDO|nr:uncharacterized protein LOC131806995 [Musca domestica]
MLKNYLIFMCLVFHFTRVCHGSVVPPSNSLEKAGSSLSSLLYDFLSILLYDELDDDDDDYNKNNKPNQKHEIHRNCNVTITHYGQPKPNPAANITTGMDNTNTANITTGMDTTNTTMTK